MYSKLLDGWLNAVMPTGLLNEKTIYPFTESALAFVIIIMEDAEYSNVRNSGTFEKEVLEKIVTIFNRYSKSQCDYDFLYSIYRNRRRIYKMRGVKDIKDADVEFSAITGSSPVGGPKVEMIELFPRVSRCAYEKKELIEYQGGFEELKKMSFKDIEDNKSIYMDKHFQILVRKSADVRQRMHTSNSI